MKSQFVWECSCGNIIHNDVMPEDCSACFRLGEFMRIQEDQLEEKTDEEILRRKKLKMVKINTGPVKIEGRKSKSKSGGKRKR